MPRHHQRLRAMCRQLQPVRVQTAAGQLTTYQRNQKYVEPAPDAQFYHHSPASSTMYSAEETEAAVPRPALTPGERLHLEIYGYVRPISRDPHRRSFPSPHRTLIDCR